MKESASTPPEDVFRNGTPIIAVIGPTATGKTDLGVDLALRFNGEVISADSRVIYQELDIGTAKPAPEEQRGVPHHMLDRAHPTEAYSVARYEDEATQALHDVWDRGKTSVVVGGTGFYLRALLQEQFIPPVPPNETLREELRQLAEARGSAHLHRLLTERDPERAAALHPNDVFRLIRALEIVHLTGKPVPKTPTRLAREVTWIGLTYADRDLHRARIDERIDVMLDAGWLAEVEELLSRYGADAEALRVTHGYPELVAYLQGRMRWEEALEQIRINIHQYARRQRTWFNRNTAIHWLAVDEVPRAQLLPTALSFIPL